jgi:secreted Zn-dependent insulinase-like peptidase
MQTTYYFSIENGKYLEALDIFREFFINPLLDKQYVDKEMNAVDSEFKNSLTSDPHRFLMLLRTLSSKDSGWNKFHIGNLETLNIPNIYKRLREFYEAEYR